MHNAKKIFTFVLSLILLLGMIPIMPAAAKDAANAVTYVTYTDSVMRAAFSDTEIKLNGLTTDDGWAMTTVVGENNRLGAQWDLENLYLAMRNEDKETITVTLNGTAIDKNSATIKSSSNKMNTEYKVSFETLGISSLTYGTEIDAEIKIGDDTWSGKIVLSSIDWIRADNANKTTSRTGYGRSGLRIVHPTSTPTDKQNSTTITGGYTYFDLYNPNGKNPESIHVRNQFLGDKTYALLGDRSVPSILEFDFYAKSMPVYKMGDAADFFPYLPSCGFVWDIHDTAKGAAMGGFSFAITNTDAGLIFQVFGTEKTESFYLNKQLGDKFRIGTLVDGITGDVTLLIDGQETAHFSAMRMDDPNNSQDYFTTTGYTIGILRNATPAASEADSFDIDVTNVAVGKYYGDSVLDTLDFAEIQNNVNKNVDQYHVTGDLTLPGEFTNGQLPAVALTWESSDASVIDPATGKVTQPSANGKLVTLTAKGADGASKEIEIFVKGLAPVGNVLAAENDLTTQKGAGEITDVHEFVFDQKNNSIIRDLGESKTVNVITLTDGDDVTRLNATMLTIWTSDDNKTYTQVPAFKLLRDGQYTYLYDFEATARYIKVHCTSHYTYDADFIGPLEDMINAEYSNVFGDGGTAFATESSVTLTNDTDTAQFDTVSLISPADAGVNSLAENYADVRFYLDGELLYHFFDGTNFQVRVTKIPKNDSVTLKVLSGNADAKDISNKEAVYEVIYGTKETYGYSSRWWIELPNGNLMAFVNVAQANAAFVYRISTDQGRSWSGNITAQGSYDYAVVPQGQIYDEDSGRILVTGWRRGEDQTLLETRYMYSDDMGRTWHKAPLTVEGYDSRYLLSYATIIKATHSYDGEDGPGVDFLHVLGHESPTMTDYYDYGYGVCVGRVAYTTDCGKTWTLSPDEIGYYDSQSDIPHIREMGISEQNILEAPNGDIVMYARCQFEDVYKLGYAVSKDHGITWSDVELSDVYSVNTQPMLYDYEDYKFLMWTGNNMYGNGSYRRDPLSVGYFTDDELRELDGIQDMFLYTGLYGNRISPERDGTNPQVVKAGDSLLTAYSYRTIRVDNYLDYFFKTKGAYDSFEQTTAKYEGWAYDGGDLSVSNDFATDGTKSMLMKAGASGRRSIPYLQNGTVAFDIYVSDVNKAKFEFELESASSRKFGEAAPIALRVEGNELSFFGSDKTAALNLNTGWNHFEIHLALTAETPAATVSVNSGTAIEIPVNIEVGDYACYAHMSCLGSLDYYLDAFYINDTDNSYIPDVVVTAETAPLTEVPENLTETYADVTALTGAMQSTVLSEAGEGYTAENTAVYALSPITSKDGGEWTAASAEDIPASGMTVMIAYPEGTAADTHAFRAADANGKSLSVAETENGLKIKVTDASPVILAWAEAADETVDMPTISVEGAIPVGAWIGIGAAVLVIAAIAVIVISKTKKKSA